MTLPTHNTFIISYLRGARRPWLINLVVDCFRTKREAVAEATRLAKESLPSQLIVKGRDGQVQRTQNY